MRKRSDRVIEKWISSRMVIDWIWKFSQNIEVVVRIENCKFLKGSMLTYIRTLFEYNGYQIQFLCEKLCQIPTLNFRMENTIMFKILKLIFNTLH